MMTLLEFIDNYMEEMSSIVVWDVNYSDDIEWSEPSFSGWVSDVPYWLLKQRILTKAECEEQEIEGPIRTAYTCGANEKVKLPAIIVFVKEE